jgi:DNA recombination protein RmuC
MNEVSALLFALLCLVSGTYSGWYMGKKLASSEKSNLDNQLQKAEKILGALADKEMALGQANLQIATLTERTSRLSDLEVSYSQAKKEISELKNELTEARVLLNAERQKSAESIHLLAEAKEALSNQFKSLASDILEEKSKKFSEQNQTNMDQIVNPLKERINDFRAKVEEIHLHDVNQQASIRAELEQMKGLNLKMTEEAHGLAMALKGQAKMQGNWGELVLENLLDRSGLRKGKDFDREVSFDTDDGKKRPDAIVYLPQGKHLVVDAKVSLNAYTRDVNATNELEQTQALSEHVVAIGNRIHELSDRNYFSLPGLNTPEMVFMFIPIESAFVEALKADETLFQKAIELNVLVATPTTLLTSLNIVKQLWRFEEQNAHTAELAERAGKVYKKLVTFLGSMDNIGKQLERAKESYTSAMGQLITGKGNLIAQAKEFERLGVSIQTKLPEELVANAVLEIEHLPDLGEANPQENSNH